MPAICPPNDTDCLLRALVDANTGFDWNPLNFAFTAALSILGFFVACFALYQALVSAGPGRLKASRIALGDHYSRLTSTQFDWTELRFRTTAKIPLIDLNKILEEPDPDKQAHKHQRTCHWSMLLPWMKQREWKPEASWYRLLGNTLTERADFKRLNCQTDYLPDDIQAAPAQAYFDSLIILAMLAGCNKLQPSEGYLLATGGGRQLDFRQHQSLGVVAVYQEYDVLGKALDRRSDDFPHLQRTILEGLGSVFHNGESFSTAVLNPSRQLVLKLDPTKLPKLDLIPKDACTHDKCARKNVLASRTYGFSPSPFSEYFNLIQYDPKVTQINALLTLLFAQKPTSAILFPTSAVNFRQPLRMICREANTNSFKFAVNLFKHLPQDHTPMESPEVDSAKPDVLVPDDLEDRSNWSQAILDNYGKAQSTDNGNRKVDEYSPKGFRLSRPALGACFDWINDAEYFDKLESESADSIRRCLHFQLRVVDWWLCSRGKVDALCSALKLIEIVRTATILQPEDDKDAIQQPYLKVSRDHIDLQTLNHFGLPWEYDSVSIKFRVLPKWKES